MEDFTNDTVFKIVDGVKTRDETFGLLIVSKTTPAMALNDDGKKVWKLIDGNRKVSEIIEILRNEYKNVDITDKTLKIITAFKKINLIHN